MAEMMSWRMREEEWRKGPWTPAEDKLLAEYVAMHGEGRWSSVAGCSGLKRNGKSCRLRWVNYLRPGLKKGHLSPQEEGIIIELHALWGNKWSTIARYLPGRTDNEIKNYWRTHFKKREKPSQNQKKRKYEAQFYQNNQEYQQGNGITNDNTTLPHDQQGYLITESSQTNLKETNRMMTINEQPQQNPCVMAQDVARWWDTVSEDGLWSGFLWNDLDRDQHPPNEAVMQQSFQMLDSLSII